MPASTRSSDAHRECFRPRLLRLPTHGWNRCRWPMRPGCSRTRIGCSTESRPATPSRMPRSSPRRRSFLVAIQQLVPRQRAVLIVRDVLGWSAKETAILLDTTVDSVNSTLRRARSKLKKQLPARRLEWAPGSDPTEAERSLLRRYMDAHERADPAAFAALLREDARLTMPPTSTWYEGREAVVAFHAQLFEQGYQWRFAVTRANRQPAVAFYTLRTGESEYRASGIDVLRIDGGLVAQIDGFVLPHLFAVFGLPPTM
jgi:RNA polymerase sigma-70 factor, ECF subfamily